MCVVRSGDETSANDTIHTPSHDDPARALRALSSYSSDDSGGDACVSEGSRGVGAAPGTGGGNDTGCVPVVDSCRPVPLSFVLIVVLR